MNILFLSNYYPPHHLGGYEELCADVAEGLRARGHTVNILTSNIGSNTPSTPHVHRLLYPEVSKTPYGATLNFFIGRKLRLEHNLHTTAQLVGALRPDVILVWGMWNLHRQIPAYLEQPGNPPVVYYIADYWSTLPDAYTLHWRAPALRSITSLPKRAVAALALRILQRESLPRLRFEHAICVSNAVRSTLITAGVISEKAAVINNGIDTTVFTPQVDGDAPPFSKILYAGRLAPEKGVDTALRAIAQLKNDGSEVHLTLVGGGTDEFTRKLEELTQQLGVTEFVTFAGRVNRTEMPRIFKKYGTLLVPSTWAEPLPRIAQEGMASGLVVISSTAGGLPEIVIDGVNGLTFAPGNATMLAQQLSLVLQNPTLARRLAAAGRDTAITRFNINRTVDEIASYMQSIIQTSS